MEASTAKESDKSTVQILRMTRQMLARKLTLMANWTKREKEDSCRGVGSLERIGSREAKAIQKPAQLRFSYPVEVMSFASVCSPTRELLPRDRQCRGGDADGADGCFQDVYVQQCPSQVER